MHSAQIAQWGIRVEAPMLSQSAKTKALQVNAVIDPAPQILSLATYLIKLELILYENCPGHCALSGVDCYWHNFGFN